MPLHDDRLAAAAPWALPALVALLGLAIATAPLGMAMGVVLACAGPHNWCEARYLLSRMPRRWGPLRPFFLTSILGVVALTIGFIALALWPRLTTSDAAWQALALATWHTGVVAWTTALLALRRREGVPRDTSWLAPIALVAVAGAWLAPTWFSVALVYAHPVLALVFLDRELATRRASWRGAYRRALGVVPVAVVSLWLVTGNADLQQRAGGGWEATAVAPEAVQAGAFLLPDTFATPLLATHVLLESLHYGVWILGMPLATAALPWHLRAVPLAGRSPAWRVGLGGGLVAGGLLVAGLWVMFAIDYETTRQAYFTVAIAHVLAEVPFLVRAT